MKSRQSKYAAMADIKKMFHQVSVKSSNTERLRFFVGRKSSERLSIYYKIIMHILVSVHLPCYYNWDLKKVPDETEDSLKTVATNNIYMDGFQYTLPAEINFLS